MGVQALSDPEWLRKMADLEDGGIISAGGWVTALSRRFQHVRQEDPKGCLIACMAMASGRTYQEVRACFPNYAGDQELGTYEAHEWLKVEGFSPIYRSSLRTDLPALLQSLNAACFVSVYPNSDRMCSHCVVRLPDGTVLDPLRDAPVRLEDCGEVHAVTTLYGDNE